VKDVAGIFLAAIALDENEIALSARCGDRQTQS